MSFPSLANQGLTTVLVLELVLAFIHLTLVMVLGSPKAACISVSLSSTDFWCTREDQLPRYAAQRKRLLITPPDWLILKGLLPTHTSTHGSSFWFSGLDANAGKIKSNVLLEDDPYIRVADFTTERKLNESLLTNPKKARCM